MRTTINITLITVICCALLAGCKKDDTPKPDAFTHSGHSYQIVKTLKTWSEAAADAVAKGGYLVEIGDEAEQNTVYQGIMDAGISAAYTNVTDGGGAAYVWIGATDRTVEGQWKWNVGNSSTGGSLFWTGSEKGSAASGSYYNWGGKSVDKLNEPDNYTDATYSPNGQNTAAIGLTKWPTAGSVELGKAGEWNDIAETNKLYYIIEFDTIN